MRFVSKAPRSKTFWVEDFTEEDEAFFKSLGFIDTKPHSSNMVAKAFERKPTLYFVGNDMFGLWSQNEGHKICHAIYDMYPEIDEIKIEHFSED